MARINPKITIRSVFLGMLLISATVMILTVRLTIASELDSLKAAAEQGKVEAQVNLGNMYAKGEVVPQNYIEAVRWFRMAAEQGDAAAQLKLGYMYDTARGVPGNNTEAVRWYRTAAEQGLAKAQYYMGLMYYGGTVGAPQSYVEAARWFRMAAEQGDVEAQLGLALIYETGLSGPKDYVQAYAWSNIASAEDYLTQGRAREFLQNITKKMTTADIIKAQELSREYWEAYGPSRASSE